MDLSGIGKFSSFGDELVIDDVSDIDGVGDSVGFCDSVLSGCWTGT